MKEMEPGINLRPWAEFCPQCLVQCQIYSSHSKWTSPNPRFILLPYATTFSSVQFSHLVVSNSLWPHGLQHSRPSCPSPIPGACSNSCPLSWWGHSTISSSIIPFSSRLQSFPVSGSFPVSHFSHQVAEVLEFQLQHQSFQWIFKTDFL